jgi:inorganic triphosphatase YgiF
LRKEGERWVQTLKAASANTMVRLEDNQDAPAPEAGRAARPDLSRHLGTPVQSGLAQALGWDPTTDALGERTGLVELYRTDIWRQSARLSTGQGTVEMALDLGHIHAGALSTPVCELEIELVDGHALAVIDTARDWVVRHGLWLDTQTKAHRGDRLARQAAGEAPPAAKRMSADGHLARLLEQFTDRMSEVGNGTASDHGAAWRESLQYLIGACPDAPGLPALLNGMAHPDDAVALARTPATTLLCLDLFARLIA